MSCPPSSTPTPPFRIEPRQTPIIASQLEPSSGSPRPLCKRHRRARDLLTLGIVLATLTFVNPLEAAPPLDLDRVPYLDLMLAGGSSPDPAWRAHREFRALHHLWRKRPAGVPPPLKVRQAPGLEGAVYAGGAFVRQSLPPNESGLPYLEASGMNLEFTLDGYLESRRRGPVTMALDGAFSLAIQPQAEGSNRVLSAPVAASVRLERETVPLVLWLAPVVLPVQSTASGLDVQRLDAGLAGLGTWTHRGGVSGVRWMVTGGQWAAESTDGESLDATLDGEGTAALSLFHLAPLSGGRFRLKGVLAGNLRRESHPELDEDAHLSASASQGATGEARLGFEGGLPGGMVLGLEASGQGGRLNQLEDSGEEGTLYRVGWGLGADAWLAVRLAERLELGLSMDVRRQDEILYPEGVSAWQLQARYGLTIQGAW